MVLFATSFGISPESIAYIIQHENGNNNKLAKMKIDKIIYWKAFKYLINMNRKVLVIGAGIHGITIAIELAKKGDSVTVIEAKDGILNGTSGATHNRVHLGYHYPRSKETAIECIQGYHHFLSDYKDSLLFPDFYYAIEKNDSNIKYMTS